jgi:hypothetical protein
MSWFLGEGVPVRGLSYPTHLLIKPQVEKLIKIGDE